VAAAYARRHIAAGRALPHLPHEDKIWEGKVSSLRHFQNEVSEVSIAGVRILFNGFEVFQVATHRCYVLEELPRSLREALFFDRLERVNARLRRESAGILQSLHGRPHRSGRVTVTRVESAAQPAQCDRLDLDLWHESDRGAILRKIADKAPAAVAD
jgi:hypothetical protein